jgi:hypothetical protein
MGYDQNKVSLAFSMLVSIFQAFKKFLFLLKNNVFGFEQINLTSRHKKSQ